MSKAVSAACVLMLVVLLAPGLAKAQEDKKGCMDYPLFSRMPDYYLSNCRESEFDAGTFVDPVSKKKVTVEGRKYFHYYKVKKEFRNKKSMLLVARNYVNAIAKIGGDSYMENRNGRGKTWMRVKKGGKEIWASIDQSNWGGNLYYLWIVEKAEMEQEVVADATLMADDLSSSGHVAVYGIYFDFNKSELNPESEPALKEIAKLLRASPGLKVFVVGHTDNVGGIEYNLKLSQARADSVVKALSARHGVIRDRLAAHGVGQLAPVAPNKTEEGRAKNRRVELVEQ
jgi:OOP family OmpA-OmpF porin